MARIDRHLVAALAAIAIPIAASGAAAQSSASYEAREHVLNAGGAPVAGQELVSPQYRLSLASLGDPLGTALLSSAQYGLAAGIVTANPPPGEVADLRWESRTALGWDPEPTVGSYNVYRDAISSLPGGFGACHVPGLTTPGTSETAIPPAGAGWFYLVTAENRLGEEGTKGATSAGVMRPNATACP